MNPAICPRTRTKDTGTMESADVSEALENLPLLSDDPLDIEVYKSISDVPEEDWNRVVPQYQVLLRKPYLLGVETGAKDNFAFRYAIVYQGESPMFCAYYQLITFEMARTLPYTTKDPDRPKGFKSSLKALSGDIIRIFTKNWEPTLLVAGNSYVTGENGFVFNPSLSTKKAFEILEQVNQHIISLDKPYGILMKDFYAHDEHPRQQIEALKYHRFQVEPNMLMHLREEWKTFEDYLAAMNTKYRQRAKSAYKKSKDIQHRDLSLEELEQNSAILQELFRNVLRDDKFALVDPDAEFIQSIKEKMGDDFKVRGYFLEGEMVAFITLLDCPKHTEAHYLGYEPSLNRSHKLYQRILYDIVAYSLERGASCISFGRTALEIKSCVGAEGKSMNLYLKINRKLINRLAAPVMARIKMPEWQPRSPFKNK